ncbi:MAG: AsmA family protein, partial [Alistipes sp.]|nr:AsmA family protein [Alistipes sp.]
MKKTLKILGIALLVLLAAALVVPLALRGRIGDIVKHEANKMLTARLDFEKLDISLLRHFPNASIDLEGLTLVGTERFEGDTIVAADRISVVVDLLSLFGDEGFDVKRILLDRPAIHAHKAADGAVNWDVMKPSDAPAPEETDEEEEPTAFRLALRDLSIDRATLRYDDDSTRTCASVSPLSLRLRGDLSTATSTLALHLEAGDIRYESAGQRLVSGLEAELRADIEADLERMRFTLSDNTLRLNAITVSLDGWVEAADEAVRTDIRLRTSQIGFRDLLGMIPAFYTRDFKNLSASGEMRLEAWAKGEMRGNSLPAFGASLSVSNGSFKYASLPQAVTDIRLTAAASNPGGSPDATVVDISDFGLTMAGNSLSASLRAATPLSDLQFSAALSGKVDLGAIREVYPLDESVALAGIVTADVKAAGRMSDIEAQRFEKLEASGSLEIEGISARVGTLPEVELRHAAASVTPQALTLGDCSLRVGRSDLEAEGRLGGYMGYLLRGERLTGSLSLRSELLDLNEILALVPESEAGDEPAEAAAPADGPAEAVVIPRNLDLSLRASVGRILLQQMTLADFTGALRVANGTLSMEQLRMKAFGGSLRATGSYATPDPAKAPALKMTLGFTEASFAQTFAELDMIRKIVPLFEKTGGNYSLDMTLATTMNADISPDLNSMNASGELRSSNIRIQNLEVFDKLATALKNDDLRKIETRDLRIGFKIADGRLRTQPFALNLGPVRLDMEGSTGLDQTIDYTAQVTLPEGASSVLRNVDVGIGGTFSSPKITVDAKKAVETAVTYGVHQQLQQLTG